MGGAGDEGRGRRESCRQRPRQNLGNLHLGGGALEGPASGNGRRSGASFDQKRGQVSSVSSESYAPLTARLPNRRGGASRNVGHGDGHFDNGAHALEGLLHVGFVGVVLNAGRLLSHEVHREVAAQVGAGRGRLDLLNLVRSGDVGAAERQSVNSNCALVECRIRAVNGGSNAAHLVSSPKGSSVDGHFGLVTNIVREGHDPLEAVPVGGTRHGYRTNGLKGL